MKRLPVSMRARLRRPERRRSPFAVPAGVRQAQLSGEPLFEGVSVFHDNEWAALEAFRPHVVIGDRTRLQRLAEDARNGEVDISSVDRAILAATPCGAPPIDDVLRVVLWQTFGVPVYELLISADGRLLGTDCEAQEGWHLEPGFQAFFAGRELVITTDGEPAIHTSLAAQLSHQPCACGRAGSLILRPERLRRLAPARRWAATA